jgi:hypothetical protein
MTKHSDILAKIVSAVKAAKARMKPASPPTGVKDPSVFLHRRQMLSEIWIGWRKAGRTTVNSLRCWYEQVGAVT